MLSSWLLFLATFLIGYVLGSMRQPMQPLSNEAIDRIISVWKKFSSILKDIHPKHVGIIERPTQADIIRKENPKLAEEEDEMRRTFGDLGVDKQ